MDYKFRTLGFLSSFGICDLPTISLASLLDPNVASASSALAKVHGARCHCRPPAVGKATWWGTGRRQAVRPMIPKPWRSSKLEVSRSMEFDTMGCLTSFWRFSCMYVFFLQVPSDYCWCFEMTIGHCHACHGSYATTMCGLPYI